MVNIIGKAKHAIPARRAPFKICKAIFIGGNSLLSSKKTYAAIYSATIG